MMVIIDILARSYDKLSFLKSYEVVGSAREAILKAEELRTNNLKKFQDLKTFTFSEQLKVHDCNKNKKSKVIESSITRILKYLKSRYYGSTIVYMIRKDYNKFRPGIKFKQVEICVVPLIHFNSYFQYHEDREYRNRKMPFGKESLFLVSSTNVAIETLFSKGNTVLEKMLDYKWDAFVYWRFYVLLLIHLVYYISYFVGVCFAQTAFGYVPGSPLSNHGQIACIVLMFFSVLLIIIQEGRQLVKAYSKIGYGRSFYNWVDFAAICLPTIVFASLLTNKPYFVSIFKI